MFLASVVPPFIFGMILVGRVVINQTGMDMGWDPVLYFMMTQALPVALLALGLGTPLVARDRAEDVLYLYAVRPVSPWYYAGGKMMAVAVPALLLLFIPGVLIAGLRLGLLPDVVTPGESLLLVGKVLIAAIMIALGYAGVSVGPSAATQRARWALLIAAGFFIIPDTVVQIIWGSDAYSLGPGNAAADLLNSLFKGEEALRGMLGALVLSLYCVVGALVTIKRVQREMIP